MQRLLLNLTIAAALFSAARLQGDDMDLLAGKWSVKKVNDEGQNYTQTIEVKKDRFVFQILGANDRVVLYSEGDLKLEKAGPFKSARFTHIRAGDSASNLDDVDDQYLCIYALDGDTWTMAVNLDKERDQKPSLDLYRRVAAQVSSLIIDEIQVEDTPQSATWYLCFEAAVHGATQRYYLENKGYAQNQVTIPVALELPKVKAAQKCTFKLQLDDVDGDACTEDVDNRSTGEFTVNERGSQSYRPEDHWRYTIRWHLK